MTPQQWRLARQVEAVVRRDVGRSVADLARMFGATVEDVRQVTWVLCRQRRVDYCIGYVVSLPARIERAA